MASWKLSDKCNDLVLMVIGSYKDCQCYFILFKESQTVACVKKNYFQSATMPISAVSHTAVIRLMNGRENKTRSLVLRLKM